MERITWFYKDSGSIDCEFYKIGAMSKNGEEKKKQHEKKNPTHPKNKTTQTPRHDQPVKRTM